MSIRTMSKDESATIASSTSRPICSLRVRAGLKVGGATGAGGGIAGGAAGATKPTLLDGALVDPWE